jgi:exodeoxyribonuclease V beta subunit
VTAPSQPRWYRPPSLGDPAAPRIVVEASAGTGKTWFVTRRVVDLLLQTDATIDQIVVVTYTEKATAELRLRLRGLLARMVHGEPEPMPSGAGPDDVWILDDDRRARLQAAVESFDAAPISTIHSFCQRVLTDESFAARRSFEQVQVPDDAALRAAFIAALRERFAHQPRERDLLRRYLAGGGSVEKLFAAVLAVYRSGAELGPSGDGPGPTLVGEMLAEVMRRADRDKRRGGMIDFHDMLRLTAQALTAADGADALARRLAARFPWALIDEFQDTDPLQWQIIDRVWGAAPARGLTVVGDPKQAIYSFRGGDVHTYLAATAALRAREAVTIDLDVCQRATSAMIDAVNHLVCRPAPLIEGGIRYDRPVTATGAVELCWDDGAACAPLALLPLQAPTSDDAKRIVADAVADEIGRLVLGSRRLRGRLRGEERPIGPGDILVLTRTNAESMAVASAIRARGVACALAQAEYLFSTIEARDVLHLLEAIASPRDHSARLRAWMTDFFAVDPDHLSRAPELSDDHPLCARLHDWRALASRLDYARLFASIMSESRVAERVLATGRGERAVTNLAHVLEHLHAEVERSRCELPELVARLRSWIRDAESGRPDDSDVQRQETDRDAVQVMTMHRAKGLEAWVVFLASHTKSNPSRSTRLYHDDDARRLVLVQVEKEGKDKDAALAELKERAKLDQTCEDQRLAYVALTRARGRLYLPVVEDTRKKKPRGRDGGGYAGVTGALFENLSALDAAVRNGKAPFACDRWSLPAGEREPLDVSTLELPAPPVLAAVASAPVRAGFIVTSYSRIKQQAQLEVEVLREEVTGEDRSRRPPDVDDLPGGPATGHLLHEALELLDVERAVDATSVSAWLARPEVTAIFATGERRHGVSARHRARAAELVHRALVTPIVAGELQLPPLGRAKLAREVEFVFPIPERGPAVGRPSPDRGSAASGPPRRANDGGERGFVKGFIDALVRWDGDERWFVVDYKSDVIDLSAEAAEEHVREHYETQVRLYALAAAAMMKLRDADDHARRFGGLLYCFLRSGRVVHRAPSVADLDAYRAELAARELS